MPDAADAWSNLTELRELTRPVKLQPPPKPRFNRRLWLRVLLLAVLPTLVVGTYFDLIAASRYVSAARFIVRTPYSSGPLKSSTTSMALMPVISGDADAYAVRDFILSRDALALLERSLPLRRMLGRASGDPFWSYPSLFYARNQEALFRYYRRIVSVSYNDSTSITTLRVQAFRPQDAQRIAAVLITGAEAMLNRMNLRSHENALSVARVEVARARAATLRAEDALTAYRNREHVVNPVEYSQTILAAIEALTKQLVDTAAQLDVTVRSSPHSPQIPLLRSRIQALQGQIDRERGVLAGSDTSLAPRIAGYERLVLLRDFAQERYVSALALLDSARLDAERQSAYLDQVVSPRAPDQPRYPYRLLWPLVTLLVGLGTCWLFRPIEPLPPRIAH